MQKQEEAIFKSVSNNQPTDSTTIFTQNAVWNALKHFPTHQMRIRPLSYITEDMKISILPTADWTDAKNVRLFLPKARSCGTQQVRILYLTKRTCETWLFRNS